MKVQGNYLFVNLLLCLFFSAATYGQTKKVVRQKTQTSQKSSSTKTSTKSNRQITITAGEFVDLGLPSGTLWATRNVGANKPEEVGDYFAWGETKAKYDYSWKNYKWCKETKDSLTKYNPSTSWGKDNRLELDLEDDAAFVNWGKEWRMPTKEQFEELIEHCFWKRVVYKGTKGYLATGKNGNSIFFPNAGIRRGTSAIDYESSSDGEYWSRTIYWSFTTSGGTGNTTLARTLACYFNVEYAASSHRSNGLQVRAVRNM